MRGKETGGREGRREGEIKNDKERRHMEGEREREKGGKETRRRKTRGKNGEKE